MSQLARDPKQIGNVIRSARKSAGMTQATLGDLSGLRQETISAIETGSPATRIDTLLRVIAALDLDLGIDARRKARNNSDAAQN
jgi:HTH-type transcriptional regulator/antitoxin HipB